jgi:hypothetical protein
VAQRLARETDGLDRVLRACDPVAGRVLTGPGIGAAFDVMSALIVSEPRRSPRRWLFAHRQRAAVAGFAAFLLSAGVAVAATQLFIPTHTHVYPPTAMITGGGPGELLNVDGTNFRQIALQISSDIPYPAGYASWRDSVISSEYQQQQDACLPGPSPGCIPKVPAGQLHGAFAATAFDAWVLDWRHDMMAGQRTAAEYDAGVISGVLNWNAVTDWDPHPSTSVPGDMGTTHATTFGWMIPFIQAVAAGDVAGVNELILSDRYGGDFAVWVPGAVKLGLEGQTLLSYLDHQGS